MFRYLLIMLQTLVFAIISASAAAPVRAHSPADETTASTQPFDDWLEQLKADARARGISRMTVESALGAIEPIPRIIELDRRQPEFTLSFREYLANVGSDERVRKGRQKLAQYRTLLNSISAEYGVSPQMIVALWGIETDFGRLTGGFEVIPALATLAHEGRRGTYFREELFNALKIIDQGHINASDMMGSWAGAMGQCQFMPSSFLRAAVDENGDGRKDIWTTEADVFASAANLLRRNGWVRGRIWGRPVKLPEGFNHALVGHDTRKSLLEWQRLGVRRSDGRNLPRVDIPGSVITPDGPDGPAFMVYENFRAILKWNRSDFFALTAGYLSDRIAGKNTVMFRK